jgi:O-antigen/teichoic acid export membrane protein
MRPMLLDRLRRARAYIFSPGLGPLFVRSLAGSSVVRIASVLATFGVGVQLARELGVQGYGYYALALSIVTIAGIPAELGLSNLVTREVSGAFVRHDYPALFGVLKWANSTCWRVSAAVAVAIAVAALLLIYSGSSVLGFSLLLGIPAIPFAALSRINGAALQGLNYITLGQVPANLLRPLFLSVALLLAWLAGAMTAPVAMALNSATAAMVYVVARIWLVRRRPNYAGEVNVQSGRSWLASTIPLAVTDGLRTLQLELTTVLLGAMTLTANVALFRIAIGTSSVAAMPMLIIAYTTMPMMARLHAERDSARLQKLVTYSAWLQTAGVLVLSLPLLVAPELLLSLVFGAGFAPAATALRILALGQIVNAAFGPNALLLNMTHRERRVTRAVVAGVALNILLLVVFARALGAAGAAIGFVAALLWWNVLLSLDSRRFLEIGTTVLAWRRPAYFTRR